MEGVASTSVSGVIDGNARSARSSSVTNGLRSVMSIGSFSATSRENSRTG